MQSSLHSQKDAVTAYSFIVFEDQVFDTHYLTKPFRKKLIHKLKKSPFNKKKQNPLPPLVELELNSRQMKKLVSWLKHHQKDLPSQKGVLSKRIDYILFCLETSIRKTEEAWGNKNDYLIRYSITTLNCIDEHYAHPNLAKVRQNNPHKYIAANATTNFEKFDNPQIVFWCLDTDGLNLNQTILNKAEHITVTPLQRFFKGNKATLHRKERNYHHPQNVSSNIDFSDIKSLQPLSYTGTDHFLIMLTPNFERISYSLLKVEKFELRNRLGNTYQSTKGIPTLGYDLFIGISRLSKSRNVGNLKLKPTQYEDILDLFTESESLSYNWSVDEMDQFLEMVEPKDENSDYGGPFLSAGIYLKKYKVGGKKGVFPLEEVEDSACERITDYLHLFKWTINIERRSNNNNEDSVTRLRAWSDPRRCNGKTLIPLHPDHVSEEILERYGTDVYGGFKPCQRYVKKNLRCPHHM